MSDRRAQTQFLLLVALVSLSTQGCARLSEKLSDLSPFARREPIDDAEATLERVEIFRRAEFERAEDLTREVERLKADLREAEAALIKAESGLAGSYTRADAISALATAKIGVERAAERSPWRRDDIESARRKLEEAERQVSEGRFGAALFFVYRAQRLSEAMLDEAEEIEKRSDSRVVKARRANLRSGPSTVDPVLTVIERGTPVFPQAQQAGWVLLQVGGGPTGWIRGDLIGPKEPDAAAVPASLPSWPASR